MSERWIVIPRWDEFQHRDAARQSVPTWIKNYVRLLHDDAYLALTGHQRAVLHGLWLEYASARRQLALSTTSLSRRLGLRVTTSTLEALNDAGFIEVSASEPARDVAGEVAGAEKRREEGPLTPRSGDDQELEEAGYVECRRCGKPVRPRSTCRYCGATPRQAGSNPRELAKPSDFERARSFTLNVGSQLETIGFLDELSKFELTPDQRHDLEQLRETQLNGQRAASDYFREQTPTSSNPFLDE